METTAQELETTIIHQPLVSVLMLTYNRAHFIPAAIESVIQQTYTNWELIIIDDGSTDQTAALVRDFNESRIRYIQHAENAGLHQRRRESLQYIKGEYVAVLDSDDVWVDTEKLSEQVEIMENQNECVVVGTFSVLIDATGKEIGRARYMTGDQSIREQLLARNQFTHSAVLMRASAIAKTKGYQPLLAEDLELFLQLGDHGTFANIAKYMTAHRVHTESMNDHGIKMCSAVHQIISMHTHYPHYTRARVRSYARLLYCRMKGLIR